MGSSENFDGSSARAPGAGDHVATATSDLHRQIVDNASDAIFTCDLEANFASVNHATEILTGYSRDELLRMSAWQLVDEECLELARQKFVCKLRVLPVTAYEIALVTKGGQRVIVELVSRLIERSGVPVGMQAIARDVTERKRIDEQRMQAQKMDAVGLLAGGIAHDFNNLLTVILGYGDVIARHVPDDEVLRAAAVEIQKAGERAAALTQQLLAFGRKQMLYPRVLDLNALITDLADRLSPVIGDGIALSLQLDSGLGKVSADAKHLSQALMNLAVHARDALPGGGTITFITRNVENSEIHVGADVEPGPGAFVQIEVTDTSGGMDAATTARIFEPFFTTMELGHGTGLGLATVHGIIRQSGGTISVESEPGRGTTFRIRLPRVGADDGASSNDVSSRVDKVSNERVLLVADDRALRGLVRQILEDSGYTVIDAGSGIDALRLFKEHAARVDLVLTDMDMAGLDGHALRDQLRGQRADVCVLFMSGRTEDAGVDGPNPFGAAPVLRKPFSPTSLGRAVRQALDMESARALRPPHRD